MYFKITIIFSFDYYYNNKKVIVIVCLIELLVGTVDAQLATVVSETYVTVSGYDVDANLATPLTSFMAIAAVTVESCMSACSANLNCAFSVLKVNNTCSMYSSAAQASVVALASSTIFERKINKQANLINFQKKNKKK
jgi:hypothetical protein